MSITVGKQSYTSMINSTNEDKYRYSLTWLALIARLKSRRTFMLILKRISVDPFFLPLFTLINRIEYYIGTLLLLFWGTFWKNATSRSNWCLSVQLTHLLLIWKLDSSLIRLTAYHLLAEVITCWICWSSRRA